MLKYLEKLVDPYPTDRLNQPFPRRFTAFIIDAADGFKKYLALLILITALTATAEAILYNQLGQLVTWLGSSQPETFWADHAQHLMFLGLVLFANLFLATSQSLIKHQIIFSNFPMRIRWRTHNLLLNQSLDFFHNDFAGRLSAKVMQVSLAVREFWSITADIFAYVLIYFVSISVILSSFSLWLMLPLLVWLGLFIASACYFIPRLNVIAREQADARAVMTGRVTDAYTNIQTVKLFAHSGREISYAKYSMQSFMQTVYRMMRVAFGYEFSVLLLSVVLYAGVIGTSLWLWMNGQAEIGLIAAATAMVIRLNTLSEFIMWQTYSLFEHIGTIQDGMSTFSRPLTLQDQPNAQELQVQHGAIDFDHVQFAYKDKNVIDDLNLSIRAGEKIGIVGRSGAGKSTLIQLLLRFYELNKGQIRIDGQDINQVTQDSLRRSIALVTQDTSLLHRTVAENIKYGRPDATDEAMYEAVRKAKADEFIPQLTDLRGKQGYDAYVGERGVKLSGGQRQRIAIARVFLKDAPILILDEATSALDSEVEAAIQSSLDELMQDKTVIAIAHRLSTIAQMDRLVVLDQGRIAEMGTHDELIAKNGIYAHLWQRQTGGFIME